MSETERLARLQEQLDAIQKKNKQKEEAAKQKIRKEKAKITEKERRDDTRRKIVYGAAIMKYCARHTEFQDKINDILIDLVEERDRYLFPNLFPETKVANDQAESVSEEFQERA